MGVRTALLALALGLVGLRPAGAANHLIVIDEVLGSWQGNDEVQFVELRMLAAGQGNLSDAGGFRGTTEIVFDVADGSGAGRRAFRFPTDVANQVAGGRILIASQALATLAGVTPDFLMPPGVLQARAGRVCYRVNPPQSMQATGLIDCVAYGAFTGDPDRFGEPTPVTPDNRALQRRFTTGQNVEDWAGALEPTPESSAGERATLRSFCGDGTISQGEECDGTRLGGATCASLGFASGEVVCEQCHYDTSGCTSCGNNAVNGREECDGTALGGRSCADLGFTGGQLRCTERCRLTTQDCDPTFLVPGGGPRGPECQAEWLVTNAAGRPGGDGRAPVRQPCRDGDAGCDADATRGTCTFSVGVCLTPPDARFTRDGGECRRVAVESWTLLRPPPGAGADGLVAATAALGPSTVTGAAVTFVPPLTAIQRCSAAVPIVVPTRGARPGRLALRARTVGAGGRPRDVDTLKLVCTP